MTPTFYNTISLQVPKMQNPHDNVITKLKTLITDFQKVNKQLQILLIMPSLSMQILSPVLRITGKAYNTPVIVEIPHSFFLILPVSFFLLFLLIPCFVLLFFPYLLVVQYRVYIYIKRRCFPISSWKQKKLPWFVVVDCPFK